jgi:prepilin-type N-terminal cleavage/methylation domain-containing protein
MKAARNKSAFTLIELLVVIGIIALLASIGVGSLRGFSAMNAVAAGNRQLLDDLNMARNYALNQRTTVYVVFVPPLDTYNTSQLTNDVWRRQLTNRLSGQFTSYNFLTLRSPGDQPGQGRAKYLSDWKSLPEGVFIAENKFSYLDKTAWYATNAVDRPFMRLTNSIPFPTADSPRTNTMTFGFPVVAFNFRGELIGPNSSQPRQGDEFIRLTRGSVVLSRDSEGHLKRDLPELIPTPKGNETNNPYVRVDWLTGRPRVEEPRLIL